MSNDSQQNSSPDFKIWVDADACPVALKEIIVKAAKRLNIKTVFVANSSMRIPKSDLFELILVPSGAGQGGSKDYRTGEAS